MLPLVKKGDLVEFNLSGERRTAKAHHSNPKTVWVFLESGQLLKIHKRKHRVAVLKRAGDGYKEAIKVTEPVESEWEKEEKPSRLDDLFAELNKSSSERTHPE